MTPAPQTPRAARTSYLSDDPASGPTVATRAGSTVVAVADTESPAVLRAVDDLVADLEAVCGVTATIAHGVTGEARVVVGTIGVSPLVDDAIARGALDVSALRGDGQRGDDGQWRWEGFCLQEVEGRLWIVGTDRRGTIFGVYDLCEAMGVSPWRWWADVPVRTRDRIVVVRGTSHTDHPSVRFRGIFLNDEEELDAWAAAHTADGTIGPATYARVFELLLRLKGNYIWPAMHVNAFNADPENGRLAEAMGVVVGTSHCDMLLRSNQHEWEPWLAAHDGPHVEYDYSLPGDNRASLHEYWQGSVRQNAGHEVTWTLGMRGIHDSGFHTRAIDEDASLSDAQKHRARVDLLGEVIADQQRLLVDELGPERARDALRTFVPYKEVLPLYDDGLDLPDDVTVVWSDDSYGHIRRFPDDRERARAGGHGLYYHSSYWSPPSRSYLWISSTPLAQMQHELRKAWDSGIRTLWVDNVGTLKPLEQDTEFFLRSAWEAGKETTTSDTTTFLAGWVDRSFSGGHGARTAAILQDFAQVTNVRKVEQLASRVFSQTAYGDEATRRLAHLRRLYDDVNEIRAALPEPERDAFMQLVALKVHASYLTNAQFLFADRSTLAHAQGKLRAADHYLAVSRRFDALRRTLVAHYSMVMSDGRWDGIMTPDAFPPPATAQHPAAQPALVLGEPGLGVVAWGQEHAPEPPHLSFSPHGTATKWIEVFTTGRSAVDYTITCDDWIDVSTPTGRVETERRLEVRIPDLARAAGRLGEVVVHSPTDGRTVVVTVAVDDPDLIPEVPRCALEADGYVSLAATSATARRDGLRTDWAVVPRLGRGGGDLVEARLRDGAAHEAHSPLPGPGPLLDESAALEYRVHLSTPGAHLLELHRYPSLDSTGRLRVAVSVDDHPPVVVETDITDEYRGAWTTAVVDQVDRLYLRLPFLAASTHVLRVHALDEWFALSRLIIHTAAPLRTHLGPPDSRWSDAPVLDRPDPAPDAHDVAGAERICREIYRVDPTSLPLPPVIHVRRDHWDSATTFTRNTVTPQLTRTMPRHPADPDGPKDILAHLAPGPVRERDGVLAIEVQRALLGTADGWRTPSLDLPHVTWTHTQAESDGGAGLALHVDAAGRRWDDPRSAPGLHVAVAVTTPGTFRVWALAKLDGNDDDAFVLALDGTPQPPSHQFSGGNLFSFGTAQAWIWFEISELEIPAGPHTLSVLARKARLRVDRLYLTLDDVLPPADADWPREGP